MSKQIRGAGFTATIHGQPKTDQIKAATEKYCRGWAFKEKKDEEKKKTEKGS